MARPLLGNWAMGTVVYSIAAVAVLLVSLYTIQIDELVGERGKLTAERRRRSTIGWALASLATTVRLAVIFSPSHTLYVFVSICWLLFFVFVTWNELRAVLRQREVTGETISMAISVYLLLGFTWALLYIVIYELQPHSFSFPYKDVVTFGVTTDKQSSVYPMLIYFSLVTLTTIGYGDITPLTMQARYAAIAEGVTGQFYLAILVARLVAMQMMTRSASQKGNQSQDPESGNLTKRGD